MDYFVCTFFYILRTEKGLLKKHFTLRFQIIIKKSNELHIKDFLNFLKELLITTFLPLWIKDTHLIKIRIRVNSKLLLDHALENFKGYVS